MVKKVEHVEKIRDSDRMVSSHAFSESSRAVQSSTTIQVQGGSGMIWARVLAYVSGTLNLELLLRNEYLAAENRILRAKIKGRLLLSDAEKTTLAETAHRLGRKALDDLAAAQDRNAAELVPKIHRPQVRWVEKSQIMGPSTD